MVKDKVDCYYTNVRREDDLLKFDVIYKDEKVEYATKMLGEFNVENAVAAILAANELGIAVDNVKKGILETTVSGRMNVFCGKNKTIIVDYAHNKLSFEKFFDAVKKVYPEADIIALFGAPGGKAYGRRKDMAETASRYAIKIYLTADDPQFESVNDICNELATFVTCDYEIIEDREKAITKAFEQMKEGAVLCLLAKGEDKYQQVRGKFEDYISDIGLAKKLTE
jgi:UDP-N-acetylmuramyl tripeptide synthase